MSEPKPTKLQEAVRLCAIGGAVKEKALTQAKAALKEASSYPVDFRVRIHGSVNKEIGTPSTTKHVRPDVSLLTRPVLAEVFRRLKVNPTSLKRILKSVAAGELAEPKFAERNADLQGVMIDAEREVLEGLPDRVVNVSGRAAAVRTPVHVEFL